MRRIYVASSWRNAVQPRVVALLRAAGHQVYDFRNPTVGYHNEDPHAYGFHWSEIDEHWQEWTPRAFRSALDSEPARQGFTSDWDAMEWADTGVLVLPSGRSAHLEAGYFSGAGKELYVLLAPGEPELMYRMATMLCLDLTELCATLADPVPV